MKKLFFILALIGLFFAHIEIFADNTPTSTVTNTPTATMTSTPGVFYIYNSLDLFINESRTINTLSGSYTWTNNWGNQIVPDVTLESGPIDAYEAIVKFDTNNIIVTVVDKYGIPVSCTFTPAVVNIRAYRNKSGFIW